MPLTDTRIKAAKPTDKVYKIYDAEGLYIEVPPTGSKRWRFKYRINGKEKRISLGIYPEIGLKDAREKRDEARRQVAAGRDPSVIKNKTAYAEKTFQHIADECRPAALPHCRSRAGHGISAHVPGAADPLYL